ncbi:MAG TPA: PEP-CTERM sorting domain-containing protein [Bryobacteraceae bacterium]|nr:PEP-CTERM sorting domain-containing protein [Bryobacteraceae bacterium]
MLAGKAEAAAAHLWRPAAKLLIGIPALILATAAVAPADLITDLGTAVLNAGNGSVVVTGNGQTNGCINWYNGGSPPDACPTAGGGTFTVDAGSTAPFTVDSSGAIQNLIFNVPLPLVDFITIGSGPSAYEFDLRDLRFNGSTAIGDCTAGANDPGATCTPANSPFQLTNGLADPNNDNVVDTVSVALTVDLYGYTGGTSGTNYDLANLYIGSFTTQQAIQGATIDSILTTIANQDSINASWSATLTPLVPTPEPATFFLVGVGLIAAGCFRKRFLRH